MPIRLTALTDPAAAPGARREVWLAEEDGVPVGSAHLRTSDRDDRWHLAELELTVHPAERRRGTGGLLLDAAAAAARAADRSVLLAGADEGGPGEAFLAARGLRRVLVLAAARLPLAEADEAALTVLAERPHPGYRLVSWDGTVPDDLLDRYVAARPAMDDMPVGDTGFGAVRWDADRLRSAAAAVAARGDLLTTTAVLADGPAGEGGGMVAFTELVVPGDGTGDAQHYGTGVLPGHRGRGLAGWMKAEQIRAVRRRHPALAGLLTDTAEHNVPMRRVNEALGYRPTHRTCHYRLDL
ncbi:N-acetyltransferase [Kitasatospora sp. NE20-6]|uniref:GNAT family N-acetyltransferase n=1 Tax=Kitasatospora sp. NE20-6 TaxID=2859066 RepID=UPI0034DBC1C0